jgi:hypothetical protein
MILLVSVCSKPPSYDLVLFHLMQVFACGGIVPGVRGWWHLCLT